MINHISSDDALAYTRQSAHRQRSYTQITPGKIDFSYSEYLFGGLQLLREKVSNGCRIDGAAPEAAMPFAMMVNPHTEGRFLGDKDISSKLLQASGPQWDISFVNEMESACVIFSKEQFRERVLHLRHYDMPNHWLDSRALATDPVALRNLRELICSVTQYLNTESALLTKPALVKQLSNHIFTLAHKALEPTLKSKPTQSPQKSRVTRVKKAMEYMEAFAYQVPASHELCAVSGLNERNLQYAFRDYLGMSAKQYLKLIRLNRVRAELKLACPQTTKISDIATNWGFFELGRFSGEYKKMFDELPSQTLRAK